VVLPHESCDESFKENGKLFVRVKCCGLVVRSCNIAQVPFFRMIPESGR
jgi:hypothetical protein